MKRLAIIPLIVLFWGCNLLTFEEHLETFTVTYHGNGNTTGEVPLDRTIYNSETNSIILPNQGTLAKERCEFLGWSTDSDNTAGLNPGYEFINYGVDDLDLYAIWSKERYTITYNYNIANVESETVILEKDDYFTVSYTPTEEASYLEDDYSPAKYNYKLPSSITNNGLTIVDWNTQPDGTGESYHDVLSHTVSNSDITLYAIWDNVTEGLEFFETSSDFQTDDSFYNYYPEDIFFLYVSGSNVREESVNIPDRYRGQRVVSISSFSDNTYIKTLTMGDSIIEIGAMAFWNCSVEEITFSNNLKYIGYSAFDSSGLKSLNLPESLTYIGPYAFIYNDSLKSVTIPSNVSEIGHKAFFNILVHGYPAGITSVTILAETPPEIFWTSDSDPEIFPGYLVSVKVPGTAISTYETTFQWNSYNYVAIE